LSKKNKPNIEREVRRRKHHVWRPAKFSSGFREAQSVITRSKLKKSRICANVVCCLMVKGEGTQGPCCPQYAKPQQGAERGFRRDLNGPTGGSLKKRDDAPEGGALATAAPDWRGHHPDQTIVRSKDSGCIHSFHSKGEKKLAQ